MFPYSLARVAQRRRLCIAQALFLISLALLLAACAPRTAPVVGPDPLNPTAASPKMKPRSFLESYVFRRPIAPGTSWKEKRAPASNSSVGRR